MNHFALEEWTDYVRQVGDADSRLAMTRHLGTCVRCRRTVDALGVVWRTLQAEPDYEVSRASLAFAHALARHLPRPRRSSLKNLVARLVFDSATSPAAAGVRSMGRSVRQTIFEVDRYQIQVQWEPVAAGARVTLIGQIRPLTDENTSPRAAISVQAFGGQRLETSGTTNEFGEFQMECAWHPNLVLRFPLPGQGIQIEVPLARLRSVGRSR